MSNIYELVEKLEEEGVLSEVVNDPNLQFDVGGQPLLFSSILPEQTVTQNHFRDHSVQFKTMMANASTRYSPPQKKENMLMSSVEVELMDSDAGGELNQEQYEHMLMLLNRNSTQEAVANLIRWFETSIARPLALLREKERVDLITKGFIHRQGAFGLEEKLAVPSFDGQRITDNNWDTPNYALLDTLKKIARKMRRKGYRINRIITTPEIEQLMLENNDIKRYGTTQLNVGDTEIDLPTLSDSQSLRAAFQAINLPVPEIYDAGYSDQEGYHFFMGQKFVMLCTTGRSEEINLGEVNEDNHPLLLSNTLGYTAIGTATGQLSPGVASKVENFDGKDARIEGSGWQTSYPVIQHPEAYVVIDVPAASNIDDDLSSITSTSGIS